MTGAVGFAETAAHDAAISVIGSIFAQIAAVESIATAVTSQVMPPTNDSASAQAVMQDRANTAQFTAMFKLGLIEVAKAQSVMTVSAHTQQASDAISAATAHAVDSGVPGATSAGSGALSTGSGSMSAMAPTLMNTGMGMVSPLMNTGTQAVSGVARSAPNLIAAAQKAAEDLPAPAMPTVPGLAAMPGLGAQSGVAMPTAAQVSAVGDAVRDGVEEVAAGGDPTAALADVQQALPADLAATPQADKVFEVANAQGPQLAGHLSAPPLPQWQPPTPAAIPAIEHVLTEPAVEQTVRAVTARTA